MNGAITHGKRGLFTVKFMRACMGTPFYAAPSRCQLPLVPPMITVQYIPFQDIEKGYKNAKLWPCATSSFGGGGQAASVVQTGPVKGGYLWKRVEGG